MIGQELGKTGHEPTPDLPDSFQMTELGPLPKEWRVVRLGEVAALSTKAVEPANAGAKRYIGLEHIEPGNIRIQYWGKANDV